MEAGTEVLTSSCSCQIRVGVLIVPAGSIIKCMLHIVHELQHLQRRTATCAGIPQAFSYASLKTSHAHPEIILSGNIEAAKRRLAHSHRLNLPKYFSIFSTKRSINRFQPHHVSPHTTNNNAEIQTRQSRSSHESRQKRQRANPQALRRRPRKPRRLPILLRFLCRQYAQYLPQASAL